jgi:hypothetical protein
LGATTPTRPGLYQDLQGKCDWVLRHQHHRYVWRNRPVAVLPANAAAGRPANNASAHKRSLKRSAAIRPSCKPIARAASSRNRWRRLKRKTTPRRSTLYSQNRTASIGKSGRIRKDHGWPRRSRSEFAEDRSLPPCSSHSISSVNSREMPQPES